METLLTANDLCSQLLGDLRPEEALRLHASCRAARVAMSVESVAAAMFAVTLDPGFGTLRQWCEVWSNCASAGEWLEASEWASCGPQMCLVSDNWKNLEEFEDAVFNLLVKVGIDNENIDVLVVRNNAEFVMQRMRCPMGTWRKHVSQDNPITYRRRRLDWHLQFFTQVCTFATGGFCR